MFSLFAEQGLNWGWVGGFECQSGQGADITLLHSPYVLIVSRSRTARRRRRRRRGKKKKKSGRLSNHTPLRRSCFRRADGTQRNKTEETDKATDGQEAVSQRV